MGVKMSHNNMVNDCTVDHANQIVIIGGGPAGLTAGYELVKQGRQPLIIEHDSIVGGIARTETYKDYRFDIGGHRFYTKVQEVEKIWHEVLSEDLLTRPRLSRIYYNGQFYRYPIRIGNTLSNLGLQESLMIMASYARWQLKPYREEETFEQWVTNRFGRRLYRTFFKTYTEKVWGIPCSAIRSDWAAQRIRGLSMRTAITNALFNTDGPKSLIEEFQYPRLGPGMMWERMQEKIEQSGGTVQLNTSATAVKHSNKRITKITVEHDGKERTIGVDELISSMPISQLIQRLDPAPPAEVLHAANALQYRDFLIVVLIVDRAELFPDNWIYIHDPNVRVGRIQNFKNWSPEMVPDQSKTSLGMEYFCSVGDEIWEKSEDELRTLATAEIDQLGLADTIDVIDATVIRQRRAYPVYDRDYLRHVQTLRSYVTQFDNLQTVGRNGMHRYNNQDHSMLTALLAARNLNGEEHDLWDVNTERSYYEEFATEET